MSIIRNHRLAASIVGVGAAAVIAWVAFGLFGVQFLFIENEVDESVPVFGGESDSTASSEPSAGSNATSGEVDSPDPADPSEPATSADPVDPADESADESADSAPEPSVVDLVSGAFVFAIHPTEGRAVVLNDGSAQRFLRFEDFRTDNGPDLNVYLTSADANTASGDIADDFIDLGNLKGNVGSQNYEIPEDVDLSRYDTVVIWCVRFGVVFGAADLA